MLIDATGGRLYYEELWDAAMDHARDIINHMPGAGDESPVQKAGGVPLDIDNMREVFGALVYFNRAARYFRRSPFAWPLSYREATFRAQSNAGAHGSAGGR